MRRLTQAFANVRFECEKRREPSGPIYLPVQALMQLAMEFDKDLGSQLYTDKEPFRGFKYAGIEFLPLEAA